MSIEIYNYQEECRAAEQATDEEIAESLKDRMTEKESEMIKNFLLRKGESNYDEIDRKWSLEYSTIKGNPEEMLGYYISAF